MSSPNASSRWPKCASARASRAGAEEARRDTMPGGGGALAAVHSGQDQAAAGQHDGSALLQPGLTCTGRTEAVLSSRGIDGPPGATGVLFGGVPPVKGVWGAAPGSPPQGPIFLAFLTDFHEVLLTILGPVEA